MITPVRVAITEEPAVAPPPSISKPVTHCVIPAPGVARAALEAEAAPVAQRWRRWLALWTAKEAVLKSFDTTIEMGLEFERKNFYLLFASEDMREGMAAFVEKRKPEWKGR